MEPLPEARRFCASRLCPLAAPEPHAGASSRSWEGGHPSGGQGLSSPSVLSNLEERGLIPG